MQIVSAPSELRELLQRHQLRNEKVGFVPTMGALHKGHFKLIQRAAAENDLSVVSIFVNPIQFNDKKDYANYPVDLDQDIKHLASQDVDYVFTPTEAQLYPRKPTISISFGKLADMMEGKFRKGHFEGVGVVVSKLMNIVNPSRAYFGLKDLQQYLLIKLMCHELNFPTEIIGVETVREQSGLALSSRNRRLSKDGIEIASSLYKGLKLIAERIGGSFSLNEAIGEVNDYYSSVKGLEVEYLEVIDPDSLELIESLGERNELAICVAGYVEGIRLIDNLYLRLKTAG